MKIKFGFGWAENKAKNYQKLFKEPLAAQLFEKYASRIEHDYPCVAEAVSFEQLQSQSGTLWLCEREKKSKVLSSEDLAKQFQRICDSGSKSLTIWIGGPNGLSVQQLSHIKPDLIWSFGPMTFPHELAAVVAAEQMYRAISIIKKHPYHSGH